MTAGAPNWQRLAELGKLPKDQRDKVPTTAILEAAEKEMERVKSQLCDECLEKIFGEKADHKNDEAYESVCGADNCDFIAKGKTKAVAENKLRLHKKIHEAK